MNAKVFDETGQRNGKIIFDGSLNPGKSTYKMDKEGEKNDVVLNQPTWYKGNHKEIRDGSGNLVWTADLKSGSWNYEWDLTRVDGKKTEDAAAIDAVWLTTVVSEIEHTTNNTANANSSDSTSNANSANARRQ